MNRIFHFVLALGFLSLQVPAQTNGLFADFSTSMGEFTLFLDHERAPMAVASFVGLATGEKSWADNTGNIWTDRPFYDGSIFHRVVKDTSTPGVTNNEAIQGGGWPVLYMGTFFQPGSVTTNNQNAQLSTTNEDGISTNFLSVAILTTNAPAVATNYVTGTNYISTNAPTVTFVSIATEVVSSNAWEMGVTNFSLKQSVHTNYSLTEEVTTNYSQTIVVITNNSGTNVLTTHSIQMEIVNSESLKLRLVMTNFANAGTYMPENVTNGLAHSNGVISMANSGPNTDGSQFFITSTDVPRWNGAYTVFGHVTTGMTVVTSIAALAVSGSGSRPVVDVVLSNVVIRRVGVAAVDFNIASQGVPVVESGPMATVRSGTNQLLLIEITTQTEMLFRESADLQTWEDADWGLYTDPSFIWTTSVARASLGDSYFFHMSRIHYPVPITSPTNQRMRTFTFYWDTDPAVKYEATFATNWWEAGGYVVTTGTNAPISGTVFVGDTWTRDPYSARLGFIDDSGKTYQYSLGFNPAQATNRFTGSYLLSGTTYPISGVFTVTGP